MPILTFEGAQYACGEDETVLDCLLRYGLSLSHSCKSGVCQSCLLRSVRGAIPERAQQGLRDTYRARGCFLSCSCVPTGDMAIARADGVGFRTPARIVGIERLNATVVLVRLKSEAPIDCRPGQYLNIVRSDGLVRSYSVASRLDEADEFEFHVARVQDGRMSTWLHSEDALGRSVDLMGPAGNCFYVPGNPEQPLFLAGTGTGLAPLYGIARDAIRQNHCGPIQLFHGSVRPEGLYLVDELRSLAQANPGLSYHACVLQGNGDASAGIIEGTIDAYSLGVVGNLKGWKAYLCGHSDFVRMMQRKTFLAGASLSAIYADAFLPSATG